VTVLLVVIALYLVSCVLAAMIVGLLLDESR